MKRIIFLTILITLISQHVKAQTFEEWFRQKATQRKYLIQQIAALKVYLGYLKDGYDIAKKGLNIVGDIKEGNFSDYSTYFSSLRLVNATVKNNVKASLIGAYQRQITNEFETLRENSGKGQLTVDELKYIEVVRANLVQECELSILLLTQVMSDYTLEMKDDERLAAIDVLYEDIKGKYAFSRSFVNSTNILIMQRSKEELEIRKYKLLNEN